MCAMAVQALYGSNDACANAIRQLGSNATDNTALSVIVSTPGCQDRLNNVNLFCDFDTISNDSAGNNGGSTSRVGVSDMHVYGGI